MADYIVKIKRISILDKLILAYHLGYFDSDEKNGLIKVIKTGILSESQSSMLDKKLEQYPDRDELLAIMDYFTKGEQKC